MNKTIAIVVALFVGSIGVAAAQEQIAAAASPAYTDVLKECGHKWRMSDERKAAEKGTGREAWNTFRAKCVKESGFVAKKSR